MDFVAIGDLVAKVGFPIVAAIGLAYVIWELARWAMRTGDRLAMRFETHVDSIEQTQAAIKPQLDRIEGKIACRAPATTSGA
jgi:hypothetical protein